MIELLSGLVVSVIVIILTRMLSSFFSAKLIAATVLVAIAFIYVGFVLKDNSPLSILLEVLVALLLYFIALIGYTRNTILIALAIIGHGVWDILHHNRWVIHSNIPSYWPSFCFIIDLIDGLYFLIIFKMEKIRRSA